LLVLNYGWSFFRKPAAAVGLLAKVNDLLISTTSEQSMDAFDTRE
jgi:hypothetical protein